MEDLLLLILLVLLFLLFVTSGAAAFLVYKYYSLKSWAEARVHQEYRKYVEAEARIQQEYRRQVEIVYRQAKEQLQKWREQELEVARKQQLEIARGEMIIKFEQWKKQFEQQIRQDAIQRSQSVTVGKITEHLVPYLPDFKYNPKDARFIGSPIDLIVFDGLNDGEVREIVFAEVKTGTSSLSERERRVKDAIQAGRVRWMEIRPLYKVNNSVSAQT